MNMCYGRKKWQVRYEDVSDKYKASAMWKNENKISLAKLPFSKYGASCVTCIPLVCCNSFFLPKSNIGMCLSLLKKTAGNTKYSIVINLFSLPLCTARLIKQNRIVSKLSVSPGKTPVFLIHAKNAFPSTFFLKQVANMKTVGFLNPAHLKYVGVYDQYRGAIWVAKFGFNSLSVFIRIEESL